MCTGKIRRRISNIYECPNKKRSILWVTAMHAFLRHSSYLLSFLSYYEVQRHLSLNPALLSGTEITLEALPFPQAHFFQVTFMEQQSKDL